MKIKSILFIFLSLLFLQSSLMTVQAQVKRKPVSSAKGTLAIEAGLIYKSGDVKPVARTTFYLLDESLAKILTDAGIQPPEIFSTVNARNSSNLVYAFGLVSKYQLNPEDKEILRKSQEAIKPHIVQSITTDFSGKAKFAPAPIGTYYVMGVANTPNGFAIWNLEVNLKTLKSVILDQNNADYAG